MSAITVAGVTKQWADRVILNDASVELHRGQIAGLVGVNGAGKTTLFRIIAGEVSPDTGTVVTARGLRIGHLRQEPQFGDQRTLREEIGGIFSHLLELESRLHRLSEEIAACQDELRAPELMDAYEKTNTRFLAAGGHTFETRMHEICGGLGFSDADLALPMTALSGGQKCRAALAKLLLSDSAFLLLDEPTNHLDIDAVRWLERFLAGHHGGAVIVSHDRYLLDRVCERILELDRGRITSYPGNYTHFVQARDVRRLTLQRQYEKDAAFIAKERDFIARHLAGQRTKEAQGRRTRLERRLHAGEFVTAAPVETRRARIAFESGERRGGTVVRGDELTMAYGEIALFSRLSFQVAAGERFGITGPNGTGKTTLLRIILGEVLPLSGTVSIGPRLKVGYYDQEGAGLDLRRSVLEEIRDARPGLDEAEARGLLGRYLFTGDDVFKPLGTLSGGEQSRVRLARLILQSPEVLILDEPTNHLDIPSRETLEEALQEFPGTIIVVSHDRYFLDRMVSRLLVLRREGHCAFEGNYSAYLEVIERDETIAKERQRTQKAERPDTAKPRLSGPSPYDRLSIDEIEAILIDQEAFLAELNQKFGDAAVYQDPSRLSALHGEVEAVKKRLAEIEAAWNDRVESQE